MLIPAAEYRPDVADLNATFTDELRNVLAANGSYIPAPGFDRLTPALPAKPLGAISVKALDGSVALFAGTAGKLYKLNNTTLAWDDVSKAATTYGATDVSPWSFGVFGNFVIAVNQNNDPQVYEIGTDTAFRDLGGNPFTQNSQGQYVLRRKADGTLIAPSLEFWDHVQRNLRSFADKAGRAGDKTAASEIDALRKALNLDLDTAVPAFKAARQGAAAFFGAEDALDAGRQFANTPRGIPEATKAFQKFNAAEKKAFATGYASELIDRIKASGDRTNVINSTFKSQSARESMELVFGAQKAKDIEAYVRVEDIVDRLRGSLGNSTTARQLIELGIGTAAGGAAGYGLSGDLQGAAQGAALGLGAKGAQYMMRKADAKVLESVARLLTSDNPQALRIAAQQAARQPSYMKALEQIGKALAVPARSAATIAAQ